MGASPGVGAAGDRTAVSAARAAGSGGVGTSGEGCIRKIAAARSAATATAPPIILFKDFGASALMFEIHFWIRMRTTMDRLQVESTVRFRIEQLFKEEGITIAFPQQDVHLDTTSPLSVQMLPPPVDAAKNDP